MANNTLRELAKEYAQGNIDKESYRSSRAELIQGTVAETIPLKEIDYPPLVQPPEPESLDETQRKDESKSPPAQKPAAGTDDTTTQKPAGSNKSDDSTNKGGFNKILIVGLVLAIIAIIIIAVIALMDNDNPGSTKQAGSASSTLKTVAPTQSRTQAQTLIQDFLDKKDWSKSTLDAFAQEWAELPVADALASKDSLETGQLTNAIYKQLLEEQALSGLVDDDSSADKQRQLVQFAADLGIEDSRISLAEELEVPEMLEETTQEFIEENEL